MLTLASRLAAVGTLVLGLILWARHPDPFSRQEIQFGDGGKNPLQAIAVRPRSDGKWPLLVYLNESDNDLWREGKSLRKMSEAGFFSVGVHLKHGEFSVFEKQFGNLLDVLEKRKLQASGSTWMVDGDIAGFLIKFAANHPDKRPDLLICMSPDTHEGPIASTDQQGASERLTFPVFIRKGTNQAYAVVQEQMFKHLHEHRNDVQLFNFENPEDSTKALFYQEAAEKARQVLFEHARIKTQVPPPRISVQPWWTFFWPGLVCLLITAGLTLRGRFSSRTGQAWRRIWAPCIAGACGLLAGAVVVWALQIKYDDSAPSLATESFVKKWNVPSNRKRDVHDYLALADYNRPLVNWNISEVEYQSHVLSPMIKSGVEMDLEWRQTFWSLFFPKIRKANSSTEAASILVQALREEVEVQEQEHDKFDMATAWNRRVTNSEGFEMLYVAALRAVGIASRISAEGDAEILDRGEWLLAPPPLHALFER